MTKIIAVQDIRTSLAAIIKQAENGEHFVVVRNSKPVFQIVPLDTEMAVQSKAPAVMKLREMRARYEARPVKKNELTPTELDRIIHDVHRG